MAEVKQRGPKQGGPQPPFPKQAQEPPGSDAAGGPALFTARRRPVMLPKWPDTLVRRCNMRRHALLVLAVGLLTAAAPEGDKELAKFDGTWVAASVEVGGKKIPDEELKKAPGRLTLKGGKWTLKAGGREQSGTFTVDAAKKPKQMDIKPGDGPNAGKTIQAIYQLDGDTMKVCYAPPGKDRPTAFETKDKAGYALIVYKREKSSK